MLHRRKNTSRIAALDGLRALAVIAVMAYHGGVAWTPGGFLGVDVFFVLSGYLITSLLVAERERTGTIALPAFWGRRARRLLPALLVLLVAVVSYARLQSLPDSLANLRSDALATLGYVANWHFIAAGRSYFGHAASASLLQHTWSLAIEEQFYLLWPLVLVGTWRGGRRRRAKVLLVATALASVGSAIEMAVLYRPGIDASRVYFGTDTHAQSVLVGAALALAVVVWRPQLDNLTRRVWSTTGLGGLALVCWAFVASTSASARLYRGGFLAVDAAAAVLVLSLTQDHDTVVSKVLALPVLRAIGAVSYGLYLWHWPVFLVVDSARTGLHGLALLSARLFVTGAISTVSYHLIEMPIRRGHRRRSLTTALAPAGLAVSAVVIFVATATSPIGAAAAVAARSAGAPPAPIPAAAAGRGFDASAAGSEPAATILLEGDSVAYTLGLGLSLAAPIYGMSLTDKATVGCGVTDDQWLRDRGNVVRVMPECARWSDAWAGDVAQTNPDLALVLIGRWEVMDRLVRGRWTHIGDPEYDARLVEELRLSVRVLNARGAHVVFLTMPCEDEGEQANGSRLPQDDPHRIALLNDLLGQVAAASGGRATVVDLASIACPQGQFVATAGGVQIRRADGVHFTTQGGMWVAPWLLPKLARTSLSAIAGVEPPPIRMRSMPT